MTIEKKLLGTNPVSGEVLPEAVSFDRVNDYLYRSSDLTGNSDGKTFTFSCWFYGATGGTIYHSGGAGYTDGVSIGFEQSGELNIKMDNPSGSTVFSVEHGGAIAMNTWNHLLISCNMSSTSNRHIYVNDVALGNSYLTYTNSDIDFTSSTHSIVQLNKLKGRLAHVFLDYTYRDLSTTSNRRLFIDADGKPSDTIPSSPILYLPMTDAATAGSNSGTGGDFTVNGVLATAERGPNQDNCSASTFDGSADYLSSVSTTTVGTDSKVLTCAFHANDTNAAGRSVFMSPAEQGLTIQFAASSGKIAIRGKNAGGSEILNIATNTGIFASNENIFVSLTIDMASQSNTKIFINNVSQAITFHSFTNDTLEFSTSGSWQIGKKGTGYFTGIIGEFYFNTAYTDLATSNPFWDSDTNRPNSVRKVIEDTSVTPLIALPIMGNDAGNNLGSGGDFTVNSGPYVGARGGSEFWARSADFDGSTKKLTRTSALVGSSNNKTMTIVCAVKANTVSTTDEIFGTNSSNNSNYLTLKRAGALFELDCDSSEGETLNVNFGSVSANTWYLLLISVDMSNTSKRHIYINGSDNNPYFGTYANFDLRSAEANVGIGKTPFGGYWDGDLGFLYFNNSYTDFSQEANRNKFVDQLGYPRDLTQQISDGDIPNPLIYMKFDDTAALGTNSGTGGNFTVNGTVTSGADFTP